ncbi:MAG: hypothetical protein WCF92_03260 [bacterium]
MSINDKLIGLAAIMLIIISFGWCIKLLLKAPIVNQIKLGTKTIQAGIPVEEKALIDQNKIINN